MSRQHVAFNRLLVIHPDATQRMSLGRIAERLAFAAYRADTWAAALKQAQFDGPFSVILLASSTDHHGERVPGASSLIESIGEIARHAGQAQIVVIAERPLTLDDCCQLLQSGVCGFVDGRDGQIPDELIIERLMQARQRYEQARIETEALNAIGPGERNSLVWQSPVMANLLGRAVRAAQVSDVPVLIYGESGTGKQLLAELIHQLDPKRSSRRLLSVNCSAITGTLAESTMFGHIKGAFTGATASRRGIFRSADGGTVLLDEIGEMDPALQPKLLRVLQEGVVMPLGSDDEVTTDVRVIAATNRKLAALVENGTFRLDLYQRLNVIALEIPPLRERPEDIPALVQFFLKKYASYYGRPIEKVDPRVFEFLTSCNLQGNVRELENTVRQMLAFKSSGTELTLGDIPPDILLQQRRGNGCEKFVLTELVDAACQLVDAGSMTLPQLVNTCEEMVLRNTLQSCGTTSAHLAKRLGLSRRTLYNKIRKYELSGLTQVSRRQDPGDGRIPRHY